MPSSYIVGMMGSRLGYAVPEILYREKMLSLFFTDITTAENWPKLLNYFPNSILPKPLRRLKTRHPPTLPASYIMSFPLFGIEYAKRLNKCRSSIEQSDVYIWAGKEFCQRINRSDWSSSDALYMFNSAALETFRAAGLRNMHKVLEQTIAPIEIEEKLLESESSSFPGWENIGYGFPFELKERQHQEWALSDRIICGSDFVKDGIRRAGGPVERCTVVPYGVTTAAETRIRSKPAGKIKVLFAGTICLRKGIQYVAAAAEKLKDIAEIRVIGKPILTQTGMSIVQKNTTVVGHVQRNLMHQEFMNADVLLCPSVCEGSAAVTYEALCRGLPVICTLNAGAPVKHDIDGIVIDVRNVDAICGAIIRLAHDKDLLTQMSENATKRASELTLNGYSRRLMEVLR